MLLPSRHLLKSYHPEQASLPPCLCLFNQRKTTERKLRGPRGVLDLLRHKILPWILFAMLCAG